MVWKFCEMWKLLRELASRWVTSCEFLSHSVRYGMYELVLKFLILGFSIQQYAQMIQTEWQTV